LPNSSRKGVIMGGNHWQHTALDHQNYYEWRRNDVLSRWREVRHCSWLRRFLWLNQKSNRRADFLARQISGTRRSVQSHEGRDSVFWFTWLKNRLIWLDWTTDRDRTGSRKDPPSAGGKGWCRNPAVLIPKTSSATEYNVGFRPCCPLLLPSVCWEL
jgi:hypothetical protein